MGGTIVTLYAITISRRCGIVLSGPAVVARGGAWRITAPVASVLGRLFPNLPLTQLKAETVSRDPAVVAAYDSDPLVYRGRMRAGLIRAFVEALKRIDAGMENVSPPILLLHGTADELAPFEGSQQLALRVARRTGRSSCTRAWPTRCSTSRRRRR
jgi:lysophospholipase